MTEHCASDDCIIDEELNKDETKKTSSVKKLKQTVLCFKPVRTVPCVVNLQPSKKRRLSDSAASSKSTRNVQKSCVLDKRRTIGCIVDEDDKEVSSSCEMSDRPLLSDSALASKCLNNVTGLKKYLYSGQIVEVTTTSDKDEELSADNSLQNEAEAIEQKEKMISDNKENIPENDKCLLGKAPCDACSDSEVCCDLHSEVRTNNTFIQHVTETGQEFLSAEENAEYHRLSGDIMDPIPEVPTENEAMRDPDLNVEPCKHSAVSDFKDDEDVASENSKASIQICDDGPLVSSEAVLEILGSNSTESVAAVVPDSSTFTEAAEPEDSSSEKSDVLCDMVNKLVETSSLTEKLDTSTKACRKITKQSKDMEQLLKQKHKEEVKQQKKEHKEQKERERLEAKMQKEREKSEKEREKNEKKKQKAEERQKQQEEEMKKKESKLEEKRRKEDEKRKRGDDKLEKDKGSQKEKMLMKNFFIKAAKDTNSFSQNESVKVGAFMPFELKSNMRLAPISRNESITLNDRMTRLDSLLEAQSSDLLYVDELKKKLGQVGKSGKTWPVEECNDLMILGSIASNMMKAKFFQFHENYRPAYYGTWLKSSSYVKGRRPFAKDTHLLDYEIDSDEEWEEEEPGESLSHSEDDDDNEQEIDPEDEDGDGFFVPHGYLSEGEGCENDEDEQASPEKLKAKQLAKARNWEVEINSKKRCEFLRPICIGVFWSDSGVETALTAGNLSKLVEHEAMFFEPQPIHLADISNISSDKMTKSLKTELKMEHKKKEKGIKYISVPDIAVPYLIQLVHGNKWSIVKLVREFQVFWRCKTAKHVAFCEGGETEAIDGEQVVEKAEELCLISKRKLDAKIREIAVYEKRPSVAHAKFWYVSSEHLEKYGLSELPVPTEWKWMTKLPDKSLHSMKQEQKKETNNIDLTETCSKLDNQATNATSTVAKKILTNRVSHSGSAIKRDERDIKIVAKPEVSLKFSKRFPKKHLIKHPEKVKQIKDSSFHCFGKDGFHPSPTESNSTAMKFNATVVTEMTTLQPVSDTLCKPLSVILEKLPSEFGDKCISDSTCVVPAGISSSLPYLDSPSQKRSSDGCTPEAKRPNLEAACFSDHIEDDCVIIETLDATISSQSDKTNVLNKDSVRAEK